MSNGGTNQEAPSRREFAERLRQETIGVRLEKAQFGVSRTVTEEQRARMADLFHADGQSVRASKQLLNKRNEHYLAVTGCLNRAREVWMEMTVPYPENGLRLIRRESVQSFDDRMTAIKTELDGAVVELDRAYREELLPQARKALGQLFNPEDYPESLVGEFDLEWSFRGIDPPDYLRQVSPRLYEQEQERIRARFEEAVALAEQAFTDEFAKMVEHLVDRLTVGPDGKAKVFRDTAVGSMREFFSRFSEMDIGSNAELSAMIAEAQRAVEGVDVAKLRKDVIARDQIRGAMQGLATRLDALMVDRPRRRIRLGGEPAQDQSAEQPESAGTEAA
jgi:hypothetical protein